VLFNTKTSISYFYDEAVLKMWVSQETFGQPLVGLSTASLLFRHTLEAQYEVGMTALISSFHSLSERAFFHFRGF
jgi:hypothetical protein